MGSEAARQATWEEACALVASSRPGVVLLIGASDTGKSTLAVRLANACLRAGRRVAVVDADVGQSDIGPPGTVGLGFPDQPVARLGEIQARNLAFVGASSPAYALGEHAVATADMVWEARKTAGAVIVDTTGMVSGPWGQRLKELKIQAIRPDWVIALCRENELAPILHGLRGRSVPQVLAVLPGALVSARSREERREARQKALARYLAEARPLVLSLERVGILRGRWKGDSPHDVPAPGAPGEELRHLWVGLGDERGRVLAAGTLLETSPRTGTMVILTPWLQAAAVTTIILGSMRVAPDGQEE